MLTAEQFRLIVSFIVPFADSINARKALITSVFFGNSTNLNIDLTGAPLEFCQRLVGALRTFGDVEPGTPALVALLMTVRPQVGVEKQAQIDELIVAILATPSPINMPLHAKNSVEARSDDEQTTSEVLQYGEQLIGVFYVQWEKGPGLWSTSGIASRLLGIKVVVTNRRVILKSPSSEKQIDVKAIRDVRKIVYGTNPCIELRLQNGENYIFIVLSKYRAGWGNRDGVIDMLTRAITLANQ